MMKKWTFIYILVCVFGFSACNEDEIKPSYADEERLEGLLDLSKPLVKEYKEKYGVNILYNFHDTLDFKFGFYSTTSNALWSNLVIHHLNSAEVVDYALEKLDEMVFTYFKDEFKQRLPYKMLLSDIVELGASNPDNLMAESDVVETGTVSVIGNTYSYMFAFNEEAMESFAEAKLKSLRDVKLYHLISHVVKQHNLYKEIPEDFYAQVDYLHEESVDTVAMMEDELPVGTGPYARYYTPEWYMGLGMALTMNSPKRSAASSYQQRLQTNNSLKFPDRERDFRNFICVMVFTKESDLRNYYLPSPLFCERMRIVMDLLESWGVDVLKINPALAMFNE